MIEDGSLFIQKAMLLNEMSDWDGIKEATEMALLDPNLENPGDVFILRGMAHTELEEYEQAIESFTEAIEVGTESNKSCLLYTSPSPRDATLSRMPSSA